MKWKWFPQLCLSVLSYFSVVSATASPLSVGNAHLISLWRISFQDDRQIKALKDNKFLLFFCAENGGWAGKRLPHPYPPRRNVGRVSLTFVCPACPSAGSELGSSYTQAASRSSRCEGQRSGREESQGRGRWIIKELGEKRRMLPWEEWRHAMRVLRKRGFVCSEGCGTTCLSEKKDNRGGQRSWSGFWLLTIFFYICIFIPLFFPLYFILHLFVVWLILQPVFELSSGKAYKCDIYKFWSRACRS